MRCKTKIQESRPDPLEFSPKGYDLATMDDISKEAEFSKGTVYIYFNSKEQLYFEIMVRGYKILIQMIEASLDDVKGRNSLERIKQIGITLNNFKKNILITLKPLWVMKMVRRIF